MRAASTLLYATVPSNQSARRKRFGSGSDKCKYGMELEGVGGPYGWGGEASEEDALPELPPELLLSAPDPLDP